MIATKVNALAKRISFALAFLFLCIWLSGCSESYSDILLQLRSTAGDPSAKYQIAQRRLATAAPNEDSEEIVELLEQAAEGGVTDAKIRLSLMYFFGGRVEKNESRAIELLREANEAGSSDAAVKLGECYIDGRGVERDPSKGFALFQKAAEQGDHQAFYKLGRCYTMGEGTSKDEVEAAKWYQKGADAGNAEAQSSLAWALFQGDGIGKNFVEAARLALEAAKGGDKYAAGFLYHFYANGIGVAKDPAEAMKWLLKSAQSGDTSAQYNLGLAYQRGELVPPDSQQAFKWLDASARGGFVLAVPLLADCYLNGRGVQQDVPKAMELLEQSANTVAGSGFRLGTIYAEGRSGIPRNPEQAVFWLTTAAEKGLRPDEYAGYAMLNLGRIYDVGMPPIEKNERLAADWYEKSIKEGVAEAKTKLAMLLLRTDRSAKVRSSALAILKEAADANEVEALLLLASSHSSGTLLPQDFSKSNDYLRKAVKAGSAMAAQHLAARLVEGSSGLERNPAEAFNILLPFASSGDAWTQFAVANKLEQGVGVSRSFVEAYKWLLIASQSGNEGVSDLARRRADFLQQQMTPSQIEQGQKLASAFVPTKGYNPTEFELVAQPVSSGSGFFISANGYIVTNAHVVDGARVITVTLDEKQVPAKLVALDQANDLAILKVDARGYPLSVITSSSVKLGATVATVGFPNTQMQGQSPKLSKGEVASLAGIQDDPRFFQISVPLQPGNSGGALFDGAGNVVGVVSSKLDARQALQQTGHAPENVNYAVKSSLLLALTESVPDLKEGLTTPNEGNRSFEETVEEAKLAAVFILVSR